MASPSETPTPPATANSDSSINSDQRAQEVCANISTPGLLSLGYQWTFQDAGSGQILASLPSTRDVFCDYKVTDPTKGDITMQVNVFVDAYPTSTIASDLSGMQFRPVPGVGSEAYAQYSAADNAGFSVLARDDHTWIQVSIKKDGLNPAVTLEQIKAAGNEVLRTHPRV